ncbi:GAF domain-containing protein [candidate division KSB1 bacterium]|nr:GAF domain-containing protein [candidate division KSB1 bacterium]
MVEKAALNQNGLKKDFKTAAHKPVNLILVSLVFGLIYWVIEAIRDVFTFGRGDILHRLFLPGTMSFWMRFLALCILVLFGVYADTLQKRIKNQKDLKTTTRSIILSGIAFGAVYWILESVRDTVVFGKGNLIERIFMPDSMSSWMRLLAVFVIVLLSLYVQNLTSEQFRIDKLLKDARDRLESAVERSMVDISKNNNYLRIENEELREQKHSVDKVFRLIKGRSQCASMMLRNSDPNLIMNLTCKSLVEEAGFRMTWVGMISEKNPQPLDNVAMFAQNAEDIDFLGCQPEEYEMDRWPIAKAVERNIPCVVENLLNPMYSTNWCNTAIKKGFQGLISLPLACNGKPFGTLNMFSASDLKLGSEELDQLKGLADDLAFSVQKLQQVV